MCGENRGDNQHDEDKDDNQDEKEQGDHEDSKDDEEVPYVATNSRH